MCVGVFWREFIDAGGIDHIIKHLHVVSAPSFELRRSEEIEQCFRLISAAWRCSAREEQPLGSNPENAQRWRTELWRVIMQTSTKKVEASAVLAIFKFLYWSLDTCNLCFVCSL